LILEMFTVEILTVGIITINGQGTIINQFTAR
jgi:hypothetical protein